MRGNRSLTYNPHRTGTARRSPTRQSIRIAGYDYTLAGAYFITICTHQRENLFGEIGDSQMKLNEMGMVVKQEWEKSPVLRPYIELGEFAIMPNHFHGIIWILDDSTGTARRAPTNNPPTIEQFGKPVSGSIPTIVRAFKSAVTRQINLIRQTPGAPVWQRNYYEHIIRDDKSYNQIAQYILDNPAKWEADKFFAGGTP